VFLGKRSRQWEHVEEKAVHLMADRKEKERGGGEGPGITFKGAPLCSGS
jgi:hypothetical protein